MFLLSLPFAGLLLALATLNLIGVNILRSPDRFWLPPIALWIGLCFLALFVGRLNVDKHQIQQTKFEVNAGRNAEEDALQEISLDDNKQLHDAFKRRMVHLIGAQSILSVFFQLWGYKQTGQEYYRKALLSFVFLSFVYIIVALLIV